MERQEFVEYVKLNRLIKEKEREVKDLRKKREDQEELILELLSQLGLDSVKSLGATIYIHRQLWANARQYEDGNRDYESACQGLIAVGHPEMVETKFNVMRVSSLVREYDKEDAIPDELRVTMEIAEKISARVRG